ncbi:MAG: MarR family transcriptional regulator [Candidatus Gastranaerophilales bacterium]|nr:MarR family transcriptional regulator [Candidatus Gastranaerophilales bacterium]MCM1072686.1 MarR family transcriptional regulator [Bacteroides sp.]
MLKDIITDRIGSIIYVVGSLVRGLSSQTFSEKSFGITPEQYLILLLIIENEGVYQRQICEITLKDRANIARIVDILLQKDLIKKVSDSNGRRIYKITATEKGKELIKEIDPCDMELREFITRGISEEELQITRKTLNKIKENVIDSIKLQI